MHIHWFVQCYKKNQWFGGGVERAYGYTARQNGRGLWLYKRLLRRCISDFFSSAMKALPRWLFANAEFLRWNASAAGLDLLQRSACRSGLPPACYDLKEPCKRANFSAALLQMPRRHDMGMSTAFLPVPWAARLSRFLRRNLRCGGKAAAYIARGPAHIGGLWRAA